MGNLNISGDIFAHNFSISLRGRTIARVSKRYLSLSDSYKLEIYDDANHAFIVALVIVLDQIYHDSNNSQSSSNQNQDIN